MCTCRQRWTDKPWQGSHSGLKTPPSSKCVLSTSSELSPGLGKGTQSDRRGPWAGKPVATRAPPSLYGPLFCPKFTTYPTDVVNLPACGGAQGGYTLPIQPGQLLLRQGALEKMGPERAQFRGAMELD